MTEDTATLITQWIRYERSMLSSIMKWNQRQPHSSTRIEIFEAIAFGRDLLNQAERKIGATNVHRSGASERQSQGQVQSQ